MRTRSRCNSTGTLHVLRPASENNRLAPLSSQTKFQYKDTVVIGNGPSAITLSYLLSGHWPYYYGNDQCQHPIDFLHERLKSTVNVPLVVQDLKELSEGLEGRSSNPVALLFDALNHPNADLGQNVQTFLKWQYHPEHAIDHVVLGRGLPGGSWQAMDGNVLTISLGVWMELPQFGYRQWEESLEKTIRPVGTREKRASVSQVARYYHDYVKYQGLRSYFRDSCIVTSVRRVLNCCCQSFQDAITLDPTENLGALNDSVICSPNCSIASTICSSCGGWSGGISTISNNRTEENILWHVSGYVATNDGQESFSYLTPNVVLATGGFDLPNSLNVPGENLSFVVKSLQAMEQLITSGQLSANSDPIMVVGAGLSAADAIIAAHFRNIPIIHVFRKQATDPSLIFRQLPPNMYPEYHKVYQMMKDKGQTYSGYTPLEQHQMTMITDDGKVRLQGPTCSRCVKVSYVIVLIGSRPDLKFLENKGQSLTVDENKPISCRNNPIDVDVYTLQSTKQPGLYAMGPLVADNFVRFAQGGALAISRHLHSKLCPSKKDKVLECSTDISCF